MSLLRAFTRNCSSKSTTEVIKNFVKRSDTGFDRVIDKIRIIKCENGNCLAELKVQKEHTNCMHGLHGGFSSTLVDMITTYALLTHKNITMVPTVSVDLHLSFLKGATIEDDIVIDAQTVRAGRTLAFAKCEIRNKKSGDVLVKGSHTKYVMK